ncbi:hypothetical protein AMTRI_Chr08g159750 [Amborella trichopoda]
MVPMPPLRMPMASPRVIMTSMAPRTFSLFISSLSFSTAITPPYLFPSSVSCAITFPLSLPFFVDLVFQSQSSQPSLYQIQCLLSLEKQIPLVQGLSARAPEHMWQEFWGTQEELNHGSLHQIHQFPSQSYP